MTKYITNWRIEELTQISKFSSVCICIVAKIENREWLRYKSPTIINYRFIRNISVHLYILYNKKTVYTMKRKILENSWEFFNPSFSLLMFCCVNVCRRWPDIICIKGMILSLKLRRILWMLLNCLRLHVLVFPHGFYLKSFPSKKDYPFFL